MLINIQEWLHKEKERESEVLFTFMSRNESR